jgi:metal-responsive CopG/Arc/MetJ family transcriptional regulator
MAGKRISVRLDEKLHKKLEQRASAVRVDESEIVRQALTEYLSKHESQHSLYDLFKKAGLIGIYKDGPRDLSTNKKYFEGFGRNK